MFSAEGSDLVGEPELNVGSALFALPNHRGVMQDIGVELGHGDATSSAEHSRTEPWSSGTCVAAP
jgi:hypothetical protein